MKYDDSNAEDSDALEGMTIKVIKPTDSAGTEGKIVIEFSSTTPKKLKGTLVDLRFRLFIVIRLCYHTCCLHFRCQIGRSIS